MENAATGLEGFMLSGGWGLSSFVFTLMFAAYTLANQYLKLPGHTLIFYFRSIIALALLPFVAFVEMPQDWKFYAAVLASAPLVIFVDGRFFDVVARFGGGVAARLRPLEVWVTFFLWFFVDWSLLAAYAAYPARTGVILLAMAGCVYFAQRQQRCTVSRAVLVALLPVLVLGGLVNVLNKYAMSFGDAIATSFAYVFVQSASMAVLQGAVMARKSGKLSFLPPGWAVKKLLFVTGLFALVAMCAIGLKNISMAFTPNPSYVAAIYLTAPVFISVYYRITGYKEVADVKNGMGVVACAIVLALAAVR